MDLDRGSYSQAFQREGPVILRDVLRSAQPPQFVAACCWAADSSRGALPVKGFLWGRAPFVRRRPPDARSLGNEGVHVPEAARFANQSELDPRKSPDPPGPLVFREHRAEAAEDLERVLAVAKT
jgi:hypothetical protein